MLSSKLQLRELGASSYWGILGVGVEPEPQRQPTPGYISTLQLLVEGCSSGGSSLLLLTCPEH